MLILAHYTFLALDGIMAVEVTDCITRQEFEKLLSNNKEELKELLGNYTQGK